MGERIQVKRKVMLIGNPCVGKTSLVRRYVMDSFSDDYISTIGFKVMNKKLLYDAMDNGNKIELSLMIWDLMGQQECKLLPQVAYESSKGAIIVCDITRNETKQNLPILTSSLFRIVPDIPIIFIANKNDLIDKLQFGASEMAEVSDQFDAPYFITSAKTGENVELAFRILGKMILKKQGINC